MRAGNVYTADYADSGEYNDDYQVIRYNPGGSRLWTAGYDGPANSYDVIQNPAVDGAGKAYVTGYKNRNRSAGPLRYSRRNPAVLFGRPGSTRFQALSRNRRHVPRKYREEESEQNV